jgi:ribosomal protein S18 acetylase RimI-like enzyme
MVTALAETRRNLDELEIGAIEPHELGAAIAVLSRGMRDNPLHIAAFGEDPERRRERIERLFMATARKLRWANHLVVARNSDGAIIGVCGTPPPGTCLPTVSEQVRLLPALLRLGPGTTMRTLRWLGAWAKHDPKSPHWHLGPLAVDANVQGQGIGSAMMRVFCARMDAAGGDAYLETDKAANVRFYGKFGFTVVAEEQVLGVPSWYMLRSGNGTSASGSQDAQPPRD